MENKTFVCQETNLKCTMLHGFLYGIASASVRRNRLLLLENKVGNIANTAT